MRFLIFRKPRNDGVCYPFTPNLRPYEALERGSPRSLEGSSTPQAQPEGEKLGVGKDEAVLYQIHRNSAIWDGGFV